MCLRFQVHRTSRAITGVGYFRALNEFRKYTGLNLIITYTIGGSIFYIYMCVYIH